MNEYQKVLLQYILMKNKIILTNTHKNHYELIKGERGTYDEYFDYRINFVLDENDEYIKNFDIDVSNETQTYNEKVDYIKSITTIINNNIDIPFYKLLILLVRKIDNINL